MSTRRRQSGPPANGGSGRAAGAVDRGRILLLEDEETVAQGLCSVLEIEGYEVVIARTCAAARKAVEHTRFTAMILDVELPDGDGVELLREMRASGIRTPAVISTGRAGALSPSRRITNTLFLLKPYGSDELMKALERLTGSPDRPRDTDRLRSG